MYIAVITADTCRAPKTGLPILVGTVISGHDAWQLCLPAHMNYMGREPVARPGDEETAAKVAEEVAARMPVYLEELALMQKRVNRLAAKFPASVDKDGNFKRNAKGEFAKEFDAVDVHIAELATARGIKSVITPPAA